MKRQLLLGPIPYLDLSRHGNNEFMMHLLVIIVSLYKSFPYSLSPPIGQYTEVTFLMLSFTDNYLVVYTACMPVCYCLKALNFD